jgi:sodium-dependent phosphate cotransporter
MIMGANIGTSVTNTIVSVFHVNNPDEYRRAFTGATFHDMFNWLCVLIFLPLEACTGFLMNLAAAAVDNMSLDEENKGNKIELLKKITKPAGGRIISVDKDIIKNIAKAAQEDDKEELKTLEDKTIIKQKSGHVFRDTPITDNDAGALLLITSMALLCVCLLLLVQLLQSVLKGGAMRIVRKLLNLEFQNCFCRQLGGLDNYILLVVGTCVTILVQSSSVFTCAITPLVGIGLIHVNKLVALTCGANIGTTVTGILSALAGSNMVIGMQVAMIHVFFNVCGTFLWFCVWPLRPIPLSMAKFMGETASKLKWFPIAYIVVSFGIMPGVVLGVSIGGGKVSAGVLVPLFAISVAFCVYAYMRRNYPDKLSECLKFDEMCGCKLPNFLRIDRDDTEDEIDGDEDEADIEEDEGGNTIDDEEKDDEEK